MASSSESSLFESDDDDFDTDSGSDFDQDDSDSDHSFGSATESEEEQDTVSTLFELDSQATDTMDDYFWSDVIEDIHLPKFAEESGPTHKLPLNASAIQYFFLLFPVTLIQVIVDNTNLYAVQCEAQSWVETTIDEMKAFLGLQILMGIIQLPRYTMYWSSDKFIETMTLKRFIQLARYMHLNDNNTQGERGTEAFDRLHKIRPVLDEIRRTFKSQMNPPQQQSIDEGMIKYKGRFSARQYMPSKPVKRGLKVFMRCDETGYCYDLWPYMGKHDLIHGRSLGERVVKHLCRALKYKGHHVFFDRFFTSISLARTLLQNGIFCCGTIKSDSEGFPNDLKNPDLERGETMQRQHDQLIATAWKDKKMVHVLSTNSSPFGDGPVIRRTKGGNFVEVLCPPPVAAYQKFMSGVDRCMQHRAKNPVGRPSKKYWKFFFNFIMEICLINAFEIFKKTTNKNVQLKSRYELLDFRMDVAESLISGYRGRKRVIPMQNTLDTPHVLSKLDRSRSTCKWCTKHGEKKRKETVFGCENCNKHLCSEQCFRAFHLDIHL